MGLGRKLSACFLFLVTVLVAEKSHAALPAAGFSFSNLCTQPAVQFIDTSTSASGSIDAWDWDFGDPSSGTLNMSQLQSPAHVYSLPGTYTVRLIVTDDSLHLDTATTIITVLQSPDADFSFTDVCFGNPTVFSDLSVAPVGDTVNAWLWSFGDLTNSSSQDPIKIYGAANSYTVTLKAFSTNLCYSLKTKTLKVHAYPQVSVSSQLTACIGDSHAFNSSAFVFNDSIVSWHWDFESGGSDSLKNTSYVYTTEGIKLITLEAASNGGCKARDSVYVQVFGPPAADFTFSPEVGYPPLNVSLSPALSASTYNWNFGDGIFSSADTIIHTYTDTGSYTICLIVSNSMGCLDTACHSVLVRDPKTDVAVIDITPVISENKMKLSARLANYGNTTLNSMDLLVDIGGSTGIQEHWTGELRPGKDMLYFFTPIFILDQNIQDPFVCVEAQNPNQGTDSDPLNNKDCRAFGQAFHAEEPYPNPVRDKIYLEYILPESGTLEITMYDILGKKIGVLYADEAHAGLNILVHDLTGLAKGIYSIRASFEGINSVKRILKY